MTPDEMDALEIRVLKLIQYDLPADIHSTHHRWVGIQMEKDVTAIQRNEAIIRHVCGWGVIGMITGLGALVLHWFEKK